MDVGVSDSCTLEVVRVPQPAFFVAYTEKHVMVRFRFGDICSCFCEPDLPGPVLNYVLQTILCFSVQGSAKKWASGCMKAAGNKARGQQAQELKSPNLEPAFLAVPCKANYPRHVSRLQINRKRQTHNHVGLDVGQFSSSVQKLLNYHYVQIATIPFQIFGPAEAVPARELDVGVQPAAAVAVDGVVDGKPRAGGRLCKKQRNDRHLAQTSPTF